MLILKQINYYKMKLATNSNEKLTTKIYTGWNIHIALIEKISVENAL